MALVGTGGMARRYLRGLEALYRSPSCNVRLAAVYGRTLSKVEALADEAESRLGQRPRVYSDLEQMARGMPEVQGVAIVTDAGSHHGVAYACLDAGYHVLIEKPLALTVRACRHVIDAARRQDRVLSVAENFRRDPMNRLARALIDDGAIGKPRLMLESRYGGGNELFITPWRHQKLTGTVTLDVGVHNADILLYFMGDVHIVYGEDRLYEKQRYPPVIKENQVPTWAAYYPVGQGQDAGVIEASGEDAFFAQIRFQNGAVGQWVLHNAAFCDERRERIVYGSKATMFCPGDRTGWPIRLEFGGGEPAIEDERILELAPSYRLEPLAAELFGSERPWTYPLTAAEVDAKVLAMELHEFGACMEGTAEPEVSGEASLRAVALVHAVSESGLLERAVTLGEVESSVVDAYQREIDEYYQLV
jgi:predicted dehydrogenase